MKYISTRNKNDKVDAETAIVKGLAVDGGLYVPESLPKLTFNQILELKDLDYAGRASKILSLFLPNFKKSDLDKYCEQAYLKFDGDPAPVVKVDDGLYMLELWHGATHAFKDIALSILPYLLTASKNMLGIKNKTLVLTATSGDTGKAALEGFKDIDGIDVIVFYPQNGVSNLQKLQMVTAGGNNVAAYGINGNFDDAQSAVKQIFSSAAAAEVISKYGYELSSANSINLGRLAPQIAYYFSSYLDLLDSNQIKQNEKINFCVPSGNFGNILAGYYAKKMGLPINKLICASNINNVLTNFFDNGAYSIKREFHTTSSPSMDILISSNLERLIFEISGRDDGLTAKRMKELKESGVYSVSERELELLGNDFFASYADDDSVFDSIAEFFDEYGYIIDTHTAVAVSVYNEYFEVTDDQTKTVIVSTASPYKFTADVLRALGETPAKTEIASLKKLEDITALPIPESLLELMNLPKRHTGIIDKNAALDTIINYCNQKK